MFRVSVCPSSGENCRIYATLVFTNRPDATHTEWQITVSHRYSSFLLTMGTRLPETCREEKYLLTYSMVQSPSWEANWFAASQEIPRILWNPKVHYHIYKCPPSVPLISQLDSVHTPTSNFLKIHLNIMLPSTPGSPKLPLSFRFSHQNAVYASVLSNTRYMPRPSNSSRFYHPNNIGWGPSTPILRQC